MLYLVKLDNAYKIGYSSNLEDRFSDLKVTHLEFEIISTKPGEIKDEKFIHYLCKDYHIKNELFEINENVIKMFNDPVLDVDIENRSLRKQIYDLENTIKILEKDKKLLEEMVLKLQNIKSYSLISDEFEEVIFEEYKNTFVQGKTIKYCIKYYKDYIKIGDLLFYNSESNKLLNDNGTPAKKYITKQNIEIYYIGTGIAINTDVINDIINTYNNL
jgi:hypothetical protein